MQKFALDNELAFSVDHAWKLLLDPKFQRRMYMEGLGFESIEVDAMQESGGVLKRSLKAVPKVQLPGPVRKILGERFAYTEEQSYDAAKGLWLWNLVIPSAGKRLHIGGDITISARGENACVRRTSFVIEAKIFGVGGLIEKTTKKETLENYEKSAVFMNTHGPTHSFD